MVRRSRLTVYFDVLEVMEKGEDKPTRIMYGTNLSWKTLNEVLETLTRSGFVRVESKGRRRIRITGKGNRALSHHRKSLKGLVIVQP